MRKALAIDLDGTLLSTNTFRDYLSYCGSAAFHNFKFGICLRIFWWVMLRKLRLVSHSRMKEALLDSTAAFMTQKSRLDHFVEKEMTYLNTRVQRIMEPYRNRGHLLVLATAAPAFYAHPIAEFLNMDLCCGTLLPSEVVIGQWHECVGHHKVEALQRLLQVHKAEIDVVITDHSDDLPLLNYNSTGRNIVVGADSKTLATIQKGCTSVWEHD
ncbi:MAG: haloacid dehalogenase-like hydrolase [Bacteroidales bacterium]|jgi:HAD superfamily phosphoserine phosphatase-like hydrolase|nr:haloacid dehalogenase-like hydrolase [Bacteroidales bacterium]